MSKISKLLKYTPFEEARKALEKAINEEVSTETFIRIIKENELPVYVDCQEYNLIYGVDINKYPIEVLVINIKNVSNKDKENLLGYQQLITLSALVVENDTAVVKLVDHFQKSGVILKGKSTNRSNVNVGRGLPIVYKENFAYISNQEELEYSFTPLIPTQELRNFIQKATSMQDEKSLVEINRTLMKKILEQNELLKSKPAQESLFILIGCLLKSIKTKQTSLIQDVVNLSVTGLGENSTAKIFARSNREFKKIEARNVALKKAQENCN